MGRSRNFRGEKARHIFQRAFCCFRHRALRSQLCQFDPEEPSAALVDENTAINSEKLFLRAMIVQLLFSWNFLCGFFSSRIFFCPLLLFYHFFPSGFNAQMEIFMLFSFVFVQLGKWHENEWRISVSKNSPNPFYHSF